MGEITKNVVWSDPRADREMPGESMSKENDADFKIAKDLSNKIADMIGNDWQDKQTIAKLIESAIIDQIRQYLREYDNEVASDILDSLESWTLGEVKGWSSEIDFDNARHAKLHSFGEEIKELIERYKKENQLQQVKEKILLLNPESDSTCENGDGKIWLSNVLTIIDEELNPPEKKKGPPEIRIQGEIKFNDDLDDDEPTRKGDVQL